MLSVVATMCACADACFCDIITHMSNLSFITFCIEFYSQHRQMPGNEVYALFKRRGLLKLLRSDYEDLHGLGMEALMQLFDEYLAKDLSA